jgi:hypothetical protein
MGFNSTTTTLTAKFTPIGRERLITNTSGLITQFALGDSDANYYCTLDLGSGEIPAMGGDLTSTSGLTSNSVTTDVVMNNKLYATGGSFFKNVEAGSSRLVRSFESLGQKSIDGSSFGLDVIARSATTTDPLVNLYQSFKLPITGNDDLAFTSRTLAQGGWSDTALTGIASDKIVVISVPNSSYGDMLNGKEVKLSISGTTGGTYNIYSTFQNKQGNIALDDSRYTETSSQTTRFAPNYAFLFSDQIKRPNGDVTKSWATGFGTKKPFSANGKSRYNLTTNNTLGLSADTAVGIVFLDKGLVVITDSTLVNDISGATSADTLTFGSASSIVNQEFTCIASRGQFTRSNNPTYVDGDTPRISEVGLYDSNGNLIAYGKTDAHIPKTANELKAFSVRINV